MSRIKEITYGRVINVGNYENVKLVETVELNEEDDTRLAFAQLMADVDTMLAKIAKRSVGNVRMKVNYKEPEETYEFDDPFSDN